MATTNDIDTKSAVRKFLEQRSIVDKENASADQSTEVQSILESIALSFLLYPQAALSFILRTKNKLQKLALSDLEIVDFLLKTIDEVNNPDDPITDFSDIVEAQTALIEVDRVGRVGSDVRAYQRYNKAINRFLDNGLAKALKRRQRKEFERTGAEAKEDLFQVLSIFNETHSNLIEHLGFIVDSISDFRSVDLARIVSSRVLSKVRSSVKKVLNGVQRGGLSKTSVAIELLSGAAALNAVSDTRDIYDPSVDSGVYPINTNIRAASEGVAAVATGTSTSVDLSSVTTPWIFAMTVDPLINGGNHYQLILPHFGASGRHYVKAASGSLTYNIPANNRTLYVRFDGVTPPAEEPVMIRAVTLTSGPSVSISTILSELNDGVAGLIDGTAVQISDTGRIMIYGSSSVTGITILDQGRGTFDAGGNYVPAAGSVHSFLGFSDQQSSQNPNVFSPEELVDLLSPYIPTADFNVVDGALTISSRSLDPLSSLEFFPGVAEDFGFTNTVYESNPSYLQLVKDGEVVDPSTLGVFVGSIVSAPDPLNTNRNLFSEIVEIVDNQLIFDDDVLLPRGESLNIRITSPLVFKVQKLIDSLRPIRSIFDSDFVTLQQVLTPILSSPTLAQINDAKSALSSIKIKIQNLLTVLESVIVRNDRREFQSIANQITSALVERGLDRALELLESAKFSEFFSLTGDTASKSARFLKATEEVGRNDLSRTTIEQDSNDIDSIADMPDDVSLPGVELMETEEQL